MRWIVKLYSENDNYVPKTIASKHAEPATQGSAYRELFEAVQCALDTTLRPSAEAERTFGASRDIYEAEYDTLTDKGIESKHAYVEFVRTAK